MIGLHRLKQTEERDRTIDMKIRSIAKFLPDPVKVARAPTSLLLIPTCCPTNVFYLLPCHR